VVDKAGEVDDGSSKSDHAKQARKRPYPEEKEEADYSIQPSAYSDCSHNTHIKEHNGEEDKEDKEDEDLRPAKRRKRHSQLTRQTPVEAEHDISQTSRSPSTIRESVPIAKYQEWPFQGFLKRTIIRNETTYNLEFKLPCMSECLSLPMIVESLDIGSNQEEPVNLATRHKTPSYSKTRAATSRQQKKRALWTLEEDTTLRTMRNDGCSWEEIHAALPHRSKGTIQVRYSTKWKV
jgi:hypothetical protein